MEAIHSSHQHQAKMRRNSLKDSNKLHSQDNSHSDTMEHDHKDSSNTTSFLPRLRDLSAMGRRIQY